MKKAINLYKEAGESPLDAINRFRNANLFYKKKKMSYAGRLDPMAEGVLLVLVDKETKRINEYLGFDKEYEAEILIGLSTDTNDILGIVDNNFKTRENVETRAKNIGNPLLVNKHNAGDSSSDSQLVDINDKGDINKEELIKKLKKKIKSLKGIYNQKIPKFSSYKIKGKPMFYYALKGEETSEIKKTIKIKKIIINSVYEINSRKLLKYIISGINLVRGDFRQEEIKKRWRELLGIYESEKLDESEKKIHLHIKKNNIIKSNNINKNDNFESYQLSQKNQENKFLVINLVINCSSGTYIRAIASDIGKEFGGGLLLSLKRTKVGKFDVRDSLRV